MRLKEYLQLIKDCPDELETTEPGRMMWMLRSRFGVGDNFPIFLQANFNDFIQFLISNDYRQTETIDRKDGYLLIRFHNNSETVILQVMNYVPLAFATNEDLSDEAKKHFEKQERDFNMGVLLHIGQKEVEGIYPERVLAIVINDIGNWATTNNIPLCFPHTRGHHDEVLDYSKIVYYPQEPEF